MPDPVRPTTPHVTLPPVSAPGRPDILPSLQAALGPAFALERELGGGGMSRVFVANEVALGRRVAVKVLAPELMQGVSAERFAREVALAARLQDPHIVPVLTTGATSGGLPYYTMPFIDGESLRERLQRGAVGLDEALRILRDVAEALEYAHGRGIVHRDIKPENVLLSGRNAVVADFGIAKAVSAARTTVPGGTLTSIGLSLGTPAYMAPEQAAGDTVDHRADLYSWGIMAWELLAGAHPFAPRALAAQLMAAQLTEMPRALDEARPGLPPMLAALVMACVAKSPDARPANAAAVLSALGGATTDLAITSGRRAPVALPTSKRRMVGVVAAVLLAVGVSGAWFATRGGDATAAAAAAAGAAPSLAVLPFEHQGDSTDAYLTDGITDEVRNKLTGVSNLAVIARASSNQYRGKDKSPQAIAKELGVRWLLTGTVRVMGSGDQRRVVVRPELVEVMPDGRLQSRGGKPFDGPLTDMVRAQGEVAEAVVGSMEVAVGGEDRARLAALPTRDPAAYDAYLRGQAVTSWGADGTDMASRRAIPLFEEAVRRDSLLLDAWAALARAQTRLYANGRERPPALVAAARASAARTMALDPVGARGLNARADIRRFVENDMMGARADLEAAVRADPSDARARATLAYLLVQQLEQPAEALPHLEQAAALDPRAAAIRRVQSQALTMLGRFDEARRAADRAVALAPDNAQAAYGRLTVDVASGDTAAARATVERLASETREGTTLLSLAAAHGWVMGRATAARALAVSASAFDGDEGEWASILATAHFMRGDAASARVWGDSAVRMLSGKTGQNSTSRPLIDLAFAHALAGQQGVAAVVANRAVAQIRAEFPKRAGLLYRSALYDAASAAAIAGARDSAIAWLTDVRSGPSWFTPALMRTDPQLASLRGDPRFEALLTKAP